MKEVLLATGQTAIVDDEDFDRIRAWKWWLLRTRNGKLYAYRPTRKDDGGYSTILMHRFIMDAKPRQLVDHINGNGLDNSKTNLRACTSSQNGANKAKIKGQSSKYKGVSLNKAKKLWQAFIKIDNRSKFLGYFKEEEEAARVYDSEAHRAFGDFARLNFPAGESK